jgi:protein deglycase
MEKEALIILADGFEEVEAVTPIDLLRRAHIKVSIVGLSSLTVRGSHGITMQADMIFAPPTPLPDALVLPGGPGHKALLNSKPLLDLIRTMNSAGNLCAAICAAPTVLGKAGILANRKATCFPGDESKLGGANFIAEAVVSDENVITSRGAGTAVPFSLSVVAALVGKEKADEIARAIVYR